LNHADLRLLNERWDGPLEEVGTRNKVGIEDRYKGCPCLVDGQPVVQRPSLETLAVVAANMLNMEAFCCIHGAPLGDYLEGLVVGVIEDLDLQLVSGPLKGCDRIDQPFRHMPLVVDGQLDQHFGA
tara:strand:+ start:3139 stop:3516 length:378 start_codon:yes stop_codon:yes gene_type:complete